MAGVIKVFSETSTSLKRCILILLAAAAPSRLDPVIRAWAIPTCCRKLKPSALHISFWGMALIHWCLHVLFKLLHTALDAAQGWQTGPLILCHWAHPLYIWSLMPVGIHRFFHQLISGQTQSHHSKLAKSISVCILLTSADRSPKIPFWNISAPLHLTDPSALPFVGGVVLLPPPFLLNLAKVQPWSLRTHSRHFHPIPQDPVNKIGKWKSYFAHICTTFVCEHYGPPHIAALQSFYTALLLIAPLLWSIIRSCVFAFASCKVLTSFSISHIALQCSDFMVQRSKGS